jgi:hypothetical protein
VTASLVPFGTTHKSGLEKGGYGFSRLFKSIPENGVPARHDDDFEQVA